MSKKGLNLLKMNFSVVFDSMVSTLIKQFLASNTHTEFVSFIVVTYYKMRNRYTREFKGKRLFIDLYNKNESQ